jgi:nicotinamide-nucleotide amidase
MRFIGIGQSQIDQVLHEHLVLPEDLTISSLFELGRVDYTLFLPGTSATDLARLKALENDLLKYIGEYMYSDDGSTLEECVIQMLAKRNTSLVTAEVGSGGAIAAGLSHAEGVSRVHSGGYVAPSDRAMADMLDLSIDASSSASDAGAGLAQSIAERICQKTHSEWGLVVSQVVEAENESRFVWVALGTRRDGFQVTRVSLRGHGETGQAQLANRCLDLLRRQLKEI